MTSLTSGNSVLSMRPLLLESSQLLVSKSPPNYKGSRMAGSRLADKRRNETIPIFILSWHNFKGQDFLHAIRARQK